MLCEDEPRLMSVDVSLVATWGEEIPTSMQRSSGKK